MIACDLVKSRVEIKRLLSPAAAERARARLLASRPGGDVRRQSGWVVTAYLDGPDRRLAKTALEQPEKNVKLRVREYFDGLEHPASPFVWVEVKSREGAVTRKSRFPLLKTRLGRLLEGRLAPSQLSEAEDPAEAMETLRRIREIVRGPLSVVGTVRCLRTSLQGGDPAARVTLDQRITYQAGAKVREEAASVLEVKHAAGPLPSWVRRIAGSTEVAEYSKFRTLALLALAEVSAA